MIRNFGRSLTQYLADNWHACGTRQSKPDKQWTDLLVGFLVKEVWWRAGLLECRHAIDSSVKRSMTA